jgi:4-amino-4-deoxy-L-arabinose transferase-like glycosyltransferase
LYIIAAKSLYDPNILHSLKIETPLPDTYYAAHMPLYPLTIRLFAPVMGYLKAMIFSTLLFTVLLTWVFYFVLKKLKITAHPFILASVFLFLPRFLVVRGIGAPEPLFMFMVLGSLFAFERKNYVLAGLLGGLAAMTKLPGILLFPAYLLVLGEQYIKTKKADLKSISILLIPVGLLAVCLLYAQQYKDFFAYWHTGYVVPMPYPYAAFNHAARWVGTGWLEDVLIYFFMYGMTVMYLKDSKYRSFYYFSLIFLIGLLFVQHRDVSRYSLPLWPMACIAFEKLFTSKKFLIVFVLLLPGIYLYAWNFMQTNVMPVSNWGPFM